MKAQLRQYALQERNKLSQDEKVEKSNAIVEKLLPYLKNKQTIAIYIPMDDEVDISSLLFLYDSVGAPKVRNTEDMDFFLIKSVDDLEKGVLNILEPTTNVLMQPNDFDVIVVPLVAFDEHKNRIGHGKGYYDRYLAQSNAFKIGVAFDIQKVECFTPSESDVVLDLIISETNIYE